MNLNPLATAALVMIGLAQVWQASTALQPTPQATHFRVVQEFCKSQAQGAATSEHETLHRVHDPTCGEDVSMIYDSRNLMGQTLC